MQRDLETMRRYQSYSNLPSGDCDSHSDPSMHNFDNRGKNVQINQDASSSKWGSLSKYRQNTQYQNKTPRDSIANANALGFGAPMIQGSMRVQSPMGG